MKCIVKKLKESVNNPSLPVLERLQILSYVTTTVEGQYCLLNTTKNTPVNQLKIDIEFEVAIAETSNFAFIAVGSNNYILKNNSYIVPYNTSRAEYFSAKVGNIQTAGFDISNGYCYVDEQSATSTTVNEHTYQGLPLTIFGRQGTYDSSAGVVRIRKVVATCIDGEHIILPCKKGEIYGFIDTKTNEFYTEVNGGALIGE